MQPETTTTKQPTICEILADLEKSSEKLQQIIDSRDDRIQMRELWEVKEMRKI